MITFPFSNTNIVAAAIPLRYLVQGGGGIETAGTTVAVNEVRLHRPHLPQYHAPRTLWRPPLSLQITCGSGLHRALDHPISTHDHAAGQMLLQSWDDVLRLFPVWPAGQPASFRHLRAIGAFLVSAAMDTAGNVDGVTVRSEAGRNCSLYSPWPTAGVIVRTATGTPVVVHRAKRGPETVFTFETVGGGTYTIAAEQ